MSATAMRARPLGAFRFSLALLVVLQHFQHLLPPADRAAFHLLGLGAVAVAIFFAISGFVVTEANDRFYAHRPAAFLANRLLRVVPPYLAALAVSIAIHAALWHWAHLTLWDFTLARPPLDPALLAGGALAMIPGFHTRYLAQDFEFIPFVWSLRVEMAFYLAACAVLAAAPMAGRFARALCAAALIAGLAAAAFLTQGRPGLLSTGPMFLAGVALYLVQHRADWPRLTLLATATLLAAIGFASWDQHGLPLLAAQLGLLAALALTLVLLVPAPMPAAWRRTDRTLGSLSYPLYLNHYAVGIALTNLTPARGPGLYALGIALSLALAFVMQQLVDQPLEGLRTHFRRANLA